MVYMGNHWLEANRGPDSSSATKALPSPFCYHNLRGAAWGERLCEARPAHSHWTVTCLPSRWGLPSFLQVLWGHKMPMALSSSNNKDNWDKWTCPINRQVHVRAPLNSWPFLGAGKRFIQYERKELGLSSKLENRGPRVKGKWGDKLKFCLLSATPKQLCAISRNQGLNQD